VCSTTAKQYSRVSVIVSALKKSFRQVGVPAQERPRCDEQVLSTASGE
jgi:hypothetical protein